MINMTSFKVISVGNLSSVSINILLLLSNSSIPIALLILSNTSFSTLSLTIKYFLHQVLYYFQLIHDIIGTSFTLIF